MERGNSKLQEGSLFQKDHVKYIGLLSPTRVNDEIYII